MKHSIIFVPGCFFLQEKLAEHQAVIKELTQQLKACSTERNDYAAKWAAYQDRAFPGYGLMPDATVLAISPSDTYHVWRS